MWRRPLELSSTMDGRDGGEGFRAVCRSPESLCFHSAGLERQFGVQGSGF